MRVSLATLQILAGNGDAGAMWSLDTVRRVGCECYWSGATWYTGWQGHHLITLPDMLAAEC